MTYSQQEKTRAIAWKNSTTTIPAEGKVPAPYVNKSGSVQGPACEFCLPSELASLTLLPEIRTQALELFAELGIPWHAGIAGGPGNHLLSSQVQCVNAMMAMVGEPARILAAFGDRLGIDEVLEIEPGRYLTFEYIGPTDFFGEAPSGQRVRGAHCTSVDAAFLHRALDGAIELVLVEWKYTESYRVRTPVPVRDLVRAGRYKAFVDDPTGPIRSNVLAFEHLLDEPFYQLVRQQLLAHELERAGVADRVRVLHVLAPENVEYQQSLARPEHRVLGGSVSEVWQKLLRHSDRFVSVDPEVFVDRVVTSDEYVLRHGVNVIRNEQELLETFEVDQLRGVEDLIEWDGDLLSADEGVVLCWAQESICVDYPFTQMHLRRVADGYSAELGL